jgi:hypothetical protein
VTFPAPRPRVEARVITLPAGIQQPEPSPTQRTAAADDASISGSEERLRTARRVFVAALAYTAGMTLFWLFFVVTQREGSAFFPRYKIDAQAIGSVIGGFLFFWIFWGWIWYLIKRALLRRLAGFSEEELRQSFASRMDGAFDLPGILARHSERRIRIVDMIGRRGRFAFIGMAGFTYVYRRLAAHPEPGFLTLGLQDGLFEAVVFGWVALVLYRSNGWLGRLFYGAQSRVMDGQLARANCLLITTLWGLFRFIMVPIGIQLAGRFPPGAYATVYIMIWGSYLASDALSEVVGSLWGRQKLRVWGLGDVNRKSIAGTWACFGGSLAVCLAAVWAQHLSPAWIGLAVLISVSNTVFELFSPRGTDDITMATANALLCWAFGAYALG